MRWRPDRSPCCGVTANIDATSARSAYFEIVIGNVGTRATSVTVI